MSCALCRLMFEYISSAAGSNKLCTTWPSTRPGHEPPHPSKHRANVANERRISPAFLKPFNSSICVLCSSRKTKLISVK